MGGGGGGVKIPNHCPKLPCDVSFPNPSTGSGLTIPTPVRSVERSQSPIATDVATHLSIRFSIWAGQVMERDSSAPGTLILFSDYKILGCWECLSMIFYFLKEVTCQ